jgi:signal transduction histidine kinase
MATRHTILVVDDEMDVVKSVQDLLRYDYRVLGSTRARDALKLMAENDIHVVMSDQRMPEMTGVEFLARARADYPDAVRLLFTGYADIRAVIDAINEGSVYRYITKPWDPDELQTIIREAVERYELLDERKRLVAELQAKNAELEKANAALREADRLKTAFIQVASHELRTPLAILQGLSDLAGRVPGIAPPLSSWLEQIRKAAARLAHLVNQIVSMLSAGEFAKAMQLEDVEVAALIDEAVEDVRVFIEQRRQTLVRDWAGDAGRFRVDRQKIRDCLNHLLLNAVKFTPDGGRITVGARRDEGVVEIFVADTGVGVDPSALPRLGDRFFTGFDVSTHSSGHFEHGRKGLGLGLSVVKSFVEMHGGTLSAQSELGKGARFTMRIPDGSSR